MPIPNLRRGRSRAVAALTLIFLAALLVTLSCSDSDARPLEEAAEAPSVAAVTQEPRASVAEPRAGAASASASASASVPSGQATERSVTLTPLGSLAPGAQGFHGDVWAHNGFAYLGTWGSTGACPATGVKIIDIADPAAPVWASTAAAYPGTSQEDMVVRSIATPSFRGDLLAVGIQQCRGGSGALAGVALWDVSDPRTPVELGFFGTGSRGVHELDLIQQGDRALALLAVPDAEANGRGGDFRILDVTDPRRPVQLSAWGVRSGLGLDLNGGIGCDVRIYDHSARASANGRRAYLSYWDAGVIILDITEPSSPRPIGRFAYPADQEGKTHSVAEAFDGRYLLVADEDDVFDTPNGLWFEAKGSGDALRVKGCESRFSRRLDETGAIEGALLDAGQACGPPPAGARGAVVLVQEGGCPFTEKAARLAEAGASALLIGVPGGPTSADGSGAVRLPVIVTSLDDVAALRRIAAAGATVTLPTERPWSGLRILDIADPADPRQVGLYQTPNSLTFPPPSAGFYTVHNAEVAGDLAFVSWYADGLRVLDIRDPANPREVAAYVPPAAANPQRILFPDEPEVWGVHLTGDLVLISDLNSGLHVLRVNVER